MWWLRLRLIACSAGVGAQHITHAAHISLRRHCYIPLLLRQHAQSCHCSHVLPSFSCTHTLTHTNTLAHTRMRVPAAACRTRRELCTHKAAGDDAWPNAWGGGCPSPGRLMCRVGQIRIFTMYMTIYFGGFPARNTIYTLYTYMVLANPTYVCKGWIRSRVGGIHKEQGKGYSRVLASSRPPCCKRK
jgi:hypothetical protein